MGIYWVLLAVFHVTLLLHTGNSCTVHIESDEDFVKFGQVAHLNCTSNCKDVFWETRLAKLSTNTTEYFSSVTVKVSDWEDSPVKCLARSGDYGKDYKAEFRVQPYVLPSRVDIDLMEELEEDKEHEVTCSVYDVAPVKHVLLSVTRGGEPFLYRTYTEDTRRERQNLTKIFKFTARRSDNLQDFACQVTLNLTRVTNTTSQSSPVTVSTYALPENPRITAEKWIEEGAVVNISCEVLHGFPSENITTKLSVEGFPNTTLHGNVFLSSTLDSNDLPLAQYNLVCVSQVFNFSKRSYKQLYVYDSPTVSLTLSRKVINLGDMVTINCSLTQGNAKYFSMTIRIDGAEVRGAHSTDLTKIVTIARRKSNVSVTCEICIQENEKVILTSEKILTVYYPPEFSDNSCPNSITWVEGDVRMFGCRSDGNPTPEEQCSFNNLSLQTSTSFTTERKLSGVYTCQASNSIGNVTKSVAVTVLYPPGTPTMHISTTSPVRVGVSVIITCHSDGQPMPTYNWTIPNDDQVVISPDRSSITIKKASSQHSGKYICHVRNRHGQSLAEWDLEVKSDYTILLVVLTCVGLIIAAVAVWLCYILRKNSTGFYDVEGRKQRNPSSEEIPLSYINKE